MEVEGVQEAHLQQGKDGEVTEAGAVTEVGAATAVSKPKKTPQSRSKVWKHFNRNN
ncbi:hypothetical protein MtrunA17_Chr5g0427201 [Medicago truncatula]|uniref:Uncharacterized protein n=1 Tax=Medicago truncatula TaxID=3880 RepID=A0A396HUP3_MEDTR|nr:hypothetical protein MtrunA17_Chr5g0427201 [Medicago truncatula]